MLNVEPDNYSQKARDILTDCWGCELIEQSCTRVELLDVIVDIDILIVRLGHKVDEEVFRAAKKLSFVVTATTGLNHIDLIAAKKYGVKVLSLKGERDFLNTLTATAELTWALLLSLVRKLPAANEHVKEGGWNRDMYRGQQLNNKVIGIIGYGRLGSIVAEYARAFRMKVLVTDPNVEDVPSWVEKVELNELLSSADVISIHVNYEESTHHLLNDTNFSYVKKGMVLINTSRGELIDEVALLKSLKNKSIAAAALDVLDDESGKKSNWPKNNLLWQYMKNNQNVIIVPHIGGATLESMEQTEIFMANKLRLNVKG